MEPRTINAKQQRLTSTIRMSMAHQDSHQESADWKIQIGSLK
jgi:hypothetical protein